MKNKSIVNYNFFWNSTFFSKILELEKFLFLLFFIFFVVFLSFVFCFRFLLVVSFAKTLNSLDRLFQHLNRCTSHQTNKIFSSENLTRENRHALLLQQKPKEVQIALLWNVNFLQRGGREEREKERKKTNID